MANPVHTAAIGAPKAWINSTAVALGILAFINLFNYLDRYLVSALVESLKHSELALTDTQAGSLMSGFLIVFAVIAPVFGALGDRMSRPRLIAFGVACWSIATALSGLAWNFTSLFIARASVGVGEAAYVTIGPSLLSDYFPRGQRGRVMAIFFCAIPVGSALGYVVGGLMDVHFGWRMAFFVAGVPGLVLALLCLGLHDPPRGSQDDDASSEGAELTVRAGSKPGGRRLFLSYGELLRNKPYVLTVAGYVAYTFALGGLAFWMPAFLERMRGIPREQATVST
jgi:MFS family permease